MKKESSLASPFQLTGGPVSKVRGRIYTILWRYNAKMILRQYSLTAEDEFPDFDIG